MKKQNILVIGMIAIVIIGVGYFILLKNSSTSTNSGNNTSVTSPSPSTTSSTYTLNQISEHNAKSNCWMAIDGKVYDFTSYVPQHPNEDIIDGCGKDATTMYEEIRKHQIKADKMLPNYQIGTLTN